MKKKFLQAVMGLFLIGVSIVYLNAFWAGSNRSSPFPQQTSLQIGNMIADSASELLQSASETFQFMNEVELAGQSRLNNDVARQRVEQAAAKVEQTLNKFREIIAIGAEAGYDAERIQQLKAFNYEQYAIDNGLSMKTMTQVAAYLEQGDMLGFYRCHAGNLENLLHSLNLVKQDLLAGKLSANNVLWSLLQQYNTVLMFGNYASLIFYQI